MISLKNVSKWYGTFQVLTDCSSEVKKGEVVVVWPLGQRQVDAHQVRQRPGAVPERQYHGRRHFGRRPEDGSSETALENRHGVPELRAVPAHERDPQPDTRAGEGARAHSRGR